MRSRLVAALGAALALLFVLPLASATAATRTQHDPRHDARRATYDVVAVRYDNAADHFSVTVRYRDLRNRRIATLVRLQGPSGESDLVVLRRADGKRRAYVVTEPTDASTAPDMRQCQGERVRWLLGRNQLRIRVPQRCLVAPEAVRAKVLTGDPRASRAADHTDWRQVPLV